MRLAVTILVSCVAALLALGMVMLYSASVAKAGVRFPVTQLIYCGMGLVLCVVATCTDYRLLKKTAWPLFGFAVVLLVLVLKLGLHKNGAVRWFNVAGLSFQPSEFAKLALLVALARYCERFQRQMPGLKRGILIPGLFISVVLSLIFVEPDVGNAMLLASVSGMVLLVAGIRLRYFLPPVLIGALAVGLFIYHNPMRSARVYSWLHLEETRQNKGQQAYQAMIALGSGGVLGKGLGDSRQKLGWVPEHETDFIFPIIGEELGLVTTLLIIAAFIAIVLSGIYIARNAPDTFGILLGSGVVFLIALQALINIAVVTSALPNKGLPLPFISRGGSNLLMMLACVGVLLSIARQARTADGFVEGDRDVEPGPLTRSRGNPFAIKTARLSPATSSSYGLPIAKGLALDL